jgi:hypothetical protein
MPDRVTVFVDGQNAYNCARAAFYPLVHARHFTDGQFDPTALGELLASRDARGFDRELHEVSVYTGRPNSAKDPKSYAAHMKQCALDERWLPSHSPATTLPTRLSARPGSREGH